MHHTRLTAPSQPERKGFRRSSEMEGVPVPVTRCDWEFARHAAGMRRPKRRGLFAKLVINGALLAVTTFSLLPLAVVDVGEEAVADAGQQQVELLWDILLGRGDAEDLTFDEARELLKVAGGGHLDFLVSALLGREQPSGARSAPPEWSRHELLLATLEQFPEPDVLRTVRAALNDEPATGDYLVAIELAGLVGGADATVDILEWAEELDPSHYASPHVQAKVIGALTVLARRHPSTVEILRSHLNDLEPALLEVVAGAARRSRSPRAIALLEAMLHRSRDLDIAVIDELSHVDIRDSVEAPSAAIDLVWPFLLSPHPEVRRHAVTALARLRAEPMFEDIVGMLSDDDEGVAHGALWALREMTARDFAKDAGVWAGWYEEEEEWFQREAPRLAALVRSDSVPDALKAVRDLSRHTIYRRNIAKWLLSGLQHEESSVVIATCSALQRLGCANALPVLIDTLRRPDERVRQTAWKTLVDMTGQDLPMEYGVWADWLNG